MESRELHLELLLGRRVHDTNGKFVGRIEEVRAEQQGEEWVIQEYLVGSAAILERLNAWKVGLNLLHMLGAYKLQGGYQIPWDKLNLTNPEQPQLACTLDELVGLSNRES